MPDEPIILAGCYITILSHGEHTGGYGRHYLCYLVLKVVWPVRDDGVIVLGCPALTLVDTWWTTFDVCL